MSIGSKKLQIYVTPHFNLIDCIILQQQEHGNNNAINRLAF